MKILITILLGLILTGVQAQLPKADIISTSKGNIIVQPVFHASLVLTFNNVAIYVDPTQGAESYDGMKKPDIILITHIHGDHLDMKTLNGLDLSNATLIVLQSVADKMPADWKKQNSGAA
jgi:L-ascorbate metabolism protein UlaG (beta-lactamase superfamily)